MTAILPEGGVPAPKYPAFSTPRPRSIQSRFILMEGGAVVLAIALMSVALTISFKIRSGFKSGVESVQQQIALQSQIRAVFDSTVLGFWRYYGSKDKQLLAEYKHSSNELLKLTRDFVNAAPSSDNRDEARNLVTLESTFLAKAELLVEQDPKRDAKEFEEVSRNTLAVQRAFTGIEKRQFATLQKATEEVSFYTRRLGIILLALGLFPIIVMLWFSHAHRQHIWTPLEALHAMVLSVREGNLDVHGDVPATVELGSVTSAFLTMAAELREMRDSLEEKVRMRANQLEAANKDLLRAAKLASLGQLVSGVAHEINNPLTSILGFSEIASSQSNLPASLRRQIQTIHDEALRLKHLVANLSQLGRRTPQQLHRIDLRTVPDRLLELRSYQLAANNISISYDRPAKAIWIMGDRDALLQLVLQLVMNAEQAIRQTEEKGEIRIACGANDNCALLSVADTGCGMDAETREGIFDPFFTAHSSHSATGLGLSISHAIVEQHGGEISVESQPGRGTTLQIQLPLAPVEDACSTPVSAAQAALVPVANDSAQSASRQRYLVIDDEPEILNLVREALGKTGAEVVTIQDSTEIASQLAHGDFDGVLCDLKMPGQDGLSILRMLREQYPDLARRFLLMTGNLADADKAARDLQGVPILPKPFGLQKLRAMVADLRTSRINEASSAVANYSRSE